MHESTTDNHAGRRAPRIPVNLAVQVMGDGTGRAMLVNVARGGVFVGTAAPAEVGSVVHLQFRMLKARVCQAVGTVVWQRAMDDAHPAGFGVAFVSTNKEMDSFVRSISNLPEKLRAIYLADVLDPRIELGVDAAELRATHPAGEVA